MFIELWEAEGWILRTSLATTEAELDAVRSLRHQVYVERNREIDPLHIDEPWRGRKMEWDAHDPFAIHLIQILRTPEGEESVHGTLRFMRCDASFAMGEDVYRDWKFSFPFTTATGDVITPEQTAEASRWISSIIELPSGRKFAAPMQLFHAGLSALRDDGRRWWINSLIHRKYEQTRHDGWPFAEIGPGGGPYRHYSGAVVTPCLLRVPEDPTYDYEVDRFLRS